MSSDKTFVSRIIIPETRQPGAVQCDPVATDPRRRDSQSVDGRGCQNQSCLQCPPTRSVVSLAPLLPWTGHAGPLLHEAMPSPGRPNCELSALPLSTPFAVIDCNASTQCADWTLSAG